jgi:hypothetical protein
VLIVGAGSLVRLLGSRYGGPVSNQLCTRDGRCGCLKTQFRDC